MESKKKKTQTETELNDSYQGLEDGEVEMFLDCTNLQPKDQLSFGELMHSMVIIVNNFIICFKVIKRLDLKCSQHKRKNCNYVM